MESVPSCGVMTTYSSNKDSDSNHNNPLALFRVRGFFHFYLIEMVTYMVHLNIKG